MIRSHKFVLIVVALVLTFGSQSQAQDNQLRQPPRPEINPTPAYGGDLEDLRLRIDKLKQNLSNTLDCGDRASLLEQISCLFDHMEQIVIREGTHKELIAIQRESANAHYQCVL